jgi:hypothetical protein
LPISLPGPAEAQLPLSRRPRGLGKNAYRWILVESDRLGAAAKRRARA